MKIFIYTNAIFQSELLVCVGSDLKQVKKWADKNSKNIKAVFKNEHNVKIFETGIKNNNGFVAELKINDLPFYILWLREWKDDWLHLDTLNHEIVHYKQYQFYYKRVIDENEFEAYFQESTFRELRKLLIKNL
jgi:hypothetical protein